MHCTKIKEKIRFRILFCSVQMNLKEMFDASFAFLTHHSGFLDNFWALFTIFIFLWKQQLINVELSKQTR